MLDRIIKLCESGKFEEAIQLIQQAIADSEANSEIYRLKGQLEFDAHKDDEAINSLIESLKLDKTNQSALILIGNIYATEKDDMETAMTYFNQVLELNTDNYVALNNIGGLLAKKEDFGTAKTYFKKTLEIRPDYSYAHFGMALMQYRQRLYADAFESCQEVLRLTINKRVDPELANIYQQSRSLIVEIAKEYSEHMQLDVEWNKVKESLEDISGKAIVVSEDPSLGTPAKFEIAEYRNQPHHKLILKEEGLTTHYYVIHELMHLQLICDARQDDANELFTSNQDTIDAFRHRFSKYNKVIRHAGISKERQVGMEDQLYQGLLLQLYNAPIDLFIEHQLYHNYPLFRPVQLLGLLEIAKTAIQGASNLELKKVVPPFVIDANIIMSVTLLLQIKELFHIDLIREIKEPHLVQKGKKLYEDFLEIRDDKSPGEEYDVIRWWAEALKLEKYYTLEKEDGF